MTTKHITATVVPDASRSEHTGKLFGIRFRWIESFVYDTAGSLSDAYEGGCWEYLALSNGGFYMRPASPSALPVICDNGFSGALSADAFGITSCLYAFSLLSYSPDADFGEHSASHFHLLRAFALEHRECSLIFAATD
jgi:hypothetical protein